MRSILRQIVAVLALVGITTSMVPATFAVTYTAQAAADKLAASGFIVDQSANPAAYRLADNLLRQEAVGTAANVLGILTVPVSEYVCQNKFSDVKASSGWVCRAAELAANAGLTNAANATFRPTANLSRFEALVFALRAAGLVPSEGLSQSALIQLGVDNGLISSSVGFNATAAATRGEFFQYVVRGLDAAETPELCEILGICPTNPNPGTGTGGAVSVSASSSSPAGYTVPMNANGLHVASFNVRAAAATTLTSVKLKRVGLSVDADVSDFTVLVDGARVTDPKDENSDDEVTLTFKNGGIKLSANQTVKLDVLLNVAASGTVTTGAEFAVSLVEVLAGGSVSGLPVTGSTFKVGSTSASEIILNTDGSVSDPKLGQTGVDLFKFKVENNSSNDTIYLQAITFEQIGSADTESDLQNFVLKKGSTVLAATARSAGDYVTFRLSTPLAITQGNNASLRVAADIIGGVGEDIQFEVDNKLDVDAASLRFGNSIAVTLTGATYASVDVDAGAVTLIKTNATTTKIREDKDDVVLGTLDIVAGQTGLEAKAIAFAVTANSGNVSALIEDVQIRNVVTGARYDLARTGAAGTTEEYGDTSFDYALMAGSNKFEVIADTLTSIASFDTKDLTLSIVAESSTTAGTNGYLRIEETSDDQVVTDITPASLTWTKVEGSESGLTASAVNTGTQSVVVGGDVAAVKFTLDSDESSNSIIDEVTVTAHSSAGLTGLTSANQVFTQAKLYKGSVAAGNLLATESASSFTFNGSTDIISVTFDNFSHTVLANTVDTFIVVYTLVDDTNLATTVDTLDQVLVTAVSAEDVDGDDITVAGLSTSDLGDTEIVGTGTLTVTVDNDNVKSDFKRNVVGGTVSPYVAGFKLVATNEAIKVKDLEVEFTDTSSDFTTSVNSVSLYDKNDVLVATKTVASSDTITFDNINYIAAEGTNYLYVKVTTNGIGKNMPGAQTANITAALDIEDAEGVSSGETLGAISVTSASNAFKVLPVRVSSVAFVSSYSGVNLATTLSGADDVIGILAVTADASSNTKSADGTTLKLELDDVRLKINTNGNVQDLDDVKLIKIGGSDSDGVSSATTACDTTDATTTLPNSPTCVFDTNSLTGEDELIPAGTTSYYKITADTVVASTGTATVRPELALLDGGTSGSTASIEYSSDDSSTLVFEAFLDFTTLSGTSVSISN